MQGLLIRGSSHAVHRFSFVYDPYLGKESLPFSFLLLGQRIYMFIFCKSSRLPIKSQPWWQSLLVFTSDLTLLFLVAGNDYFTPSTVQDERPAQSKRSWWPLILSCFPNPVATAHHRSSQLVCLILYHSMSLASGRLIKMIKKSVMRAGCSNNVFKKLFVGALQASRELCPFWVRLQPPSSLFMSRGYPYLKRTYHNTDYIRMHATVRVIASKRCCTKIQY